MEDVLDRVRQAVEDYAPSMVGAVVILIVGWVIAWAVSRILRSILHRTSIDNRIAAWMSQGAGSPPVAGSVERGISSGVFWIIILLTVIAALEALDLGTVTQPLNDVVEDILGFLPNLIAAILILIVGWVVATVLRRVVENIVRAFGVDRAGDRAGLRTDQQMPPLSEVVGLILFAIILIPAIVAALNALELEVVAGPTSRMLDDMLSILPNLFAAIVLVAIAYIVARIVSQIVVSLLGGIGFDGLPERLGASPNQATGRTTPSQLVGYLLLVGILLVATMEALRVIGFVLLAELIREFLVFSGQVLLGVIIIGIGLFMANLAARAIQTSGTTNGGLLATVARVAIIGFALAVGLRQMGIANEIIILAFALPLGALAVAAAIALGLGGREVAARELEEARQRARGRTGGGT